MPLFYQSMMERGKLDEIDATGYGILFLLQRKMEERVPAEYLATHFWCLRALRITERVLWTSETAASHYETQLRPPFFRALVDYVNQQ